MYNPLPKTNDKTFSFPFQCVMLKIVGAWPLANTNSQLPPLSLFGYIYYIWSYTLIMLIAVTCLAQSSFVYHAWGDILTVTECGCTVLMGIHNFLRLIHLSTQRSSLKVLIREFVHNIWISTKHEKTIAVKCEKDMVILKIISILLFLLICMYVTLPLLELSFTDIHNDKNKPFPYKMIFPYNTNDNIGSYAITYVLTSLAGFGVVTTLFAEDSLFGFFVEYTCGQFSILHRKIERMIIDGELEYFEKYHHVGGDGGGDQSKQQIEIEKKIIIRKHLKEIILHHNVIIRFAQHLETFFAPILLVNFTISSMLICMVGLQITAVKLTIGNYAKLFLYIVSALSQLFILCSKGDKLIEYSTKTAWKFYSCNWYGFANSIRFHKMMTTNNEKEHTSRWNTNVAGEMLEYPSVDIYFKHNLCFAIRRSQKPLTITALKFSILSLKSFAAILSTSLSYFTLLRTLVEKE